MQWCTGVSYYRTSLMWIIGCAGFSSSIPLILLVSTLIMRLTEVGLSKREISFFVLLHAPYSLKFLITPVITSIGNHKSRVLWSHIFVAVAITGLGYTDPVSNLLQTAFFTLLLTFFSAVLDIVLYEYMQCISEENCGIAASFNITGWRIGTIVAGSLVPFLSLYYGWLSAYLVVVFMLIASMLAILCIDTNIISTPMYRPTFIESCKRSIIAVTQIYNFSKTLVIVCLFKAGDTMIHTMAYSFFNEVGFTKADIVNVVKIFGVAATIGGGIIAGPLIRLSNVNKFCFIAGALHMCALLSFSLLTYYPRNMFVFSFVIAIEHFSNGIMTAGFVGYLYKISGKNQMITLYAFLWAIFSLSRTIAGSIAGYIVEPLGWNMFFLFSALLAIPALILLKTHKTL